MSLRAVELKSEASLVKRENHERIKLQARQFMNRVINRTLFEHDQEFMERYEEDGTIWEVGTISKGEIEDLFRTATLKEIPKNSLKAVSPKK